MENPGLFEKYLDGSLNDTERSDFLKRIQSDSAFAAQFRVYEAMESLMQQTKDRQDFKSVMRSAAEAYFAENKENVVLPGFYRRHFSVICKVAASVALIFALSLSAYIVFTSDPSGRDLYAEYYSPLKTDFVTRSVSAPEDIVQKAFVKYQQGDSKACLSLLSNATISDSLKTPVNIIRGLAYMDTGDFVNAETYLKQASFDKSNILYNDCLWYLSLTYLSLEQPDKAMPALQTLIDNSPFYATPAKEILKEIKE